LVQKTEEFVQAKSLSGPDFTVEIVNNKYADDVAEVNPIYWHWAEKLLLIEGKDDKF
jgi:hypothetical protein